MKVVLSYFIVLLLQSLLNAHLKGQDSFDKDICQLQNEIVQQFRIRKPILTRVARLKKLLDDLNITESETRTFFTDKSLCGTCHLLIKHIQEKKLRAKDLAQAICNIYITLSTLTISNFCDDLLRVHLPVLEYIAENSTIIDPQFACSVLLQKKLCYYRTPPLAWTTQVPLTAKKVPTVHYDKDAKPLKILHLTDFHISPDYEIGGVERCGYPVCCKKNVGNPLFGRNAGHWGTYNCDIPLWLFGQTMLHLNHTYKDVDLVYFTGDVIDHTVWKASRKENSELLYVIFKTLHETFPNVPILPIIGNHETAPLNVFPPPDRGIEDANLSAQWLYNLLSKIWSIWLPKEALATVEKQGYYSYTVNNKFKIIALNNNVCYNFNWWLLYATYFLREQLEFLTRELEMAEENEQFVHILAHIPVGNRECIEPWEISYNNLVKRFSHIIKGQFYGHTHTDDLKLFYDDQYLPINVGYNGASLTPFVNYNPNYKLMYVNPHNYEVLDIHTYYFNLTYANLNPYQSPKWLKLYSMKEAYGLNDLTPTSVHNAAVNITVDESAFKKYWRFMGRNGDPYLSDGCDKQCKKEAICKMFTTQSFNSTRQGC